MPPSGIKPFALLALSFVAGVAPLQSVTLDPARRATLPRSNRPLGQAMEAPPGAFSRAQSHGWSQRAWSGAPRRAPLGRRPGVRLPESSTRPANLATEGSAQDFNRFAFRRARPTHMGSVPRVPAGGEGGQR